MTIRALVLLIALGFISLLSPVFAGAQVNVKSQIQANTDGTTSATCNTEMEGVPRSITQESVRDAR